MYMDGILGFVVAFVATLLITPLVIKIAKKFDIVDKPNARKVHKNIIPRLGGAAIFFGVTLGFFAAGLTDENMTTIICGGIIMFVLGVFDDKYDLPAVYKFLVQLFVAMAVVRSGLAFQFIDVPFIGAVETGALSGVLTVLWILGVTNAINLIDGLDGLSGGISFIALTTTAFLAAMEADYLCFVLAMIYMGSLLGFLFHNFHPAKIFMGDSGSLFVGYSIAIISLLGSFKSATFVSLLIPVMILGVPVFDTLAAIVRRIANKRSISAPDKGHMHHRLLELGFSHRASVLILYGLAIMFSVNAIIFSKSTTLGSIFVIIAMLIVIEIVTEMLSIVHEDYKPILGLMRKIFIKEKRRRRRQNN